MFINSVCDFFFCYDFFFGKNFYGVDLMSIFFVNLEDLIESVLVNKFEEFKVGWFERNVFLCIV